MVAYLLSIGNAALTFSSCILNRNKVTLLSQKKNRKSVNCHYQNSSKLFADPRMLTFEIGSISKNASVSQSEISKDSWIRSLAAASSPVLDDGANARAP